MKQQKDLIILNRTQWKDEDRVCYRVRASHPLPIGTAVAADRETHYFSGRCYLVYQVFVVGGAVRCCNCPAFGSCRHMDGICEIVLAQATLEHEIDRRAAPLAYPATKFVALNRARILPVVAGVRFGMHTIKVVDLATIGTLNGAQSATAQEFLAGLPSNIALRQSA